MDVTVYSYLRWRSRTYTNYETVFPVVTGAGIGVRAASKIDDAAKLATSADKAADVGKVAKKGGENAAAKHGREVHKDFSDKVKAKQDKGWQSEPRIKDKTTGSYVKPDAVTPSGRPVELKPNTSSGRAAGRAQLKRYERVLKKRGRVVYYDPKGLK